MGNIASEKSVTATRLIEARTVLGLSVQDTAKALAFTLEDLQDLEAGHMVPGAFELRRFSRLYRRNVAWFLGEENDPEVDEKLLEAAKELSEADKEKVLSFARFLAANPSTI